MASILYNRTFTIQASHFNGKRQYVTYRLFQLGKAHPNDVDDMLLGIHGHNFRINVEVELDDDLDSEGFAIDDEQLETIIRRYDRQNISVHCDFTENNERATTERIAEKYAKRIVNTFDPEWSRFIKVEVTVHETDEIFAKAVVDEMG